jgi:peptide/nickel transport system substrate-binding protein
MHRLINRRQPILRPGSRVERLRLSSTRNGRLRPRMLGAIGAIALSATVLAACSSAGSTGPSGSAQTTAIVPMTAGSTPDQIFPIFTGAQYTVVNEQDFQWLMYRPLLWYGGQPGNEFGLYNEVSLADAPVYSHNDTVVTITMKKYAWSDGTPVTARDVQFEFNLIKANKTSFGPYNAGDFPDNVKTFQVLSPTQMRLTLTRPYSPLWFDTNELALLTPLPQQVWDKTSAGQKVGNYDETPAGAIAVYKYLFGQSSQLSSYATNPLWQVVDGPWKLKSFSTRGDIVLAANKRYSGPVKPTLNEFTERPFTSDTAEFNALLAQTGLTTGTIPTADLSQTHTLESEGYRGFRSLTYGLNNIYLNYNNTADGPLFRQLYIRQALQKLVNQPQDVQYALHGAGNPSYGPVPLAPGSPYTTAYEKSNPYPYSVTAAKQLLASHGWAVHLGGTDTCVRPGTGPADCGAGIAAGKALALKVLYPSGDPGFAVMMESWQSSAHSAGIAMTLNSGEFNQVTSEISVCKAGTAACNWQAGTWGGWTMGQYPTGQGIFTTGTTGMPAPVGTEINKLVKETEFSSNPQEFTTYENYVTKQLPTLFMPWEQGNNSVVLKTLQGYTADQQNPFADTFPEYWHFSK